LPKVLRSVWGVTSQPRLVGVALDETIPPQRDQRLTALTARTYQRTALYITISTAR